MMIKKKKIKKIAVIAAAVLVCMLLAALIYIPASTLSRMTGYHITSKVHDPSEYGIAAQNLTLTTDDGLKISAYLTETDRPKGTIIILSGIDNPSVTAFFGYAKFFADNGYSALLIEMRAHNASEGDEAALGMKEWLDVKAGVDFLKNDEKLKTLPVIAMGTSMGAASVDVAAGEIPQIDAVISLSAFSSIEDYFYDFLTGAGFPRFFAEMERPFVKLAAGVHYGFGNVKYTPLRGISKLGGRPVLLMHSTGDTQVPYRSYERLLSKAKSATEDITVFVREGDEHFICYDDYFEEPSKDTEFSGALLNFLDSRFGN